MDQGNMSERDRSDFNFKSGQPSQLPKSSQSKSDDPQAVKQEFVHIKQKVDALLDHLENIMKEPAKLREMMRAKEMEQELGSRIPKKPKTNEETHAENNGAVGGNQV
uniref:Heterogeneous nuclear ribonucleoprotein C-like n=1 Tax=Phascolarctos cinereus TaxID=38626 RepID=A0A6P5JVG8_PHACI|nr:heterogeneous nuclear ribonucleoprotein C-like [Phascolarctos cinereus]